MSNTIIIRVLSKAGKSEEIELVCRKVQSRDAHCG